VVNTEQALEEERFLGQCKHDMIHSGTFVVLHVPLSKHIILDDAE